MGWMVSVVVTRENNGWSNWILDIVRNAWVLEWIPSFWFWILLEIKWVSSQWAVFCVLLIFCGIDWLKIKCTNSMIYDIIFIVFLFCSFMEIWRISMQSYSFIIRIYISHFEHPSSLWKGAVIYNGVVFWAQPRHRASPVPGFYLTKPFVVLCWVSYSVDLLWRDRSWEWC